MTAKGQSEKPTPLGDRVYRKHRKMLKEISKKLGKKNAESVRFLIEEAHARICTKT